MGGTDDELPTTTVTPVVAADDVRFEDLQSIGNAVVIEQVAGLTVDQATTWGRERGRSDVYEIDLAAQLGDRGYAANLDPTRFRVLHCDGTVVSAVVG